MITLIEKVSVAFKMFYIKLIRFAYLIAAAFFLNEHFPQHSQSVFFCH